MIIVTRHAALVEYLHEQNIAPESARVIDHATIADVEGQHVIGVLPLRLAAHAKSVTEVPMDIPAELRGVELTIEQVRQFAGEPATYTVKRETAAAIRAELASHGITDFDGLDDDLLVQLLRIIRAVT